MVATWHLHRKMWPFFIFFQSQWEKKWKNSFSMNRDRTKRLRDYDLCEFNMFFHFFFICIAQKHDAQRICWCVDLSFARTHTRKINKQTLFSDIRSLMFLFNFMLVVVFLLCVHCSRCAWQVQNCLSFSSFFSTLYLFWLLSILISTAYAHTHAFCSVWLGSAQFHFNSTVDFLLFITRYIIKYMQ